MPYFIIWSGYSVGPVTWSSHCKKKITNITLLCLHLAVCRVWLEFDGYYEDWKNINQKYVSETLKLYCIAALIIINIALLIILQMWLTFQLNLCIHSMFGSHRKRQIGNNLWMYSIFHPQHYRATQSNLNLFSWIHTICLCSGNTSWVLCGQVCYIQITICIKC